jgi:hypothetical protein
MPALRSAVGSIEKAERLLLNAVEAVNDGDILTAMLSVNEAKLTASSGAAVAKVANEVLGTIIDILA